MFDCNTFVSPGAASLRWSPRRRRPRSRVSVRMCVVAADVGIRIAVIMFDHIAPMVISLVSTTRKMATVPTAVRRVRGAAVDSW